MNGGYPKDKDRISLQLFLESRIDSSLQRYCLFLTGIELQTKGRIV